MANILVSACLIGCPCRYDGLEKENEKVLLLQKEHTLIPVCPEQLGGLKTPRNPAERVQDKVLTEDGTDVTKEYRLGAENALKIAKIAKADYCILKAKSPSCGCGRIYNGTFSRVLKKGDGLTAQLLKEAGYKVMTEEDL